MGLVYVTIQNSFLEPARNSLQFPESRSYTDRCTPTYKSVLHACALALRPSTLPSSLQRCNYQNQFFSRSPFILDFIEEKAFLITANKLSLYNESKKGKRRVKEKRFKPAIFRTHDTAGKGSAGASRRRSRESRSAHLE